MSDAVAGSCSVRLHELACAQLRLAAQSNQSPLPSEGPCCPTIALQVQVAEHTPLMSAFTNLNALVSLQTTHVFKNVPIHLFKQTPVYLFKHKPIFAC